MYVIQRILIAICVIMGIAGAGLSSVAQNYSAINKADEIKSLVSYSMDGNGFWIKRPPMVIDEFNDSVSLRLIGKNNKSRTVYGMTHNSIIQFVFSKDDYLIFKNNKSLTNYKTNEWDVVYSSQADRLDDSFRVLNNRRSIHIEDSIASIHRIQQMEAEEQSRREAFRRDSVRAVLKAEKLRLESERYRAHNPITKLDISGFRKSLYLRDSYDYEDDDYTESIDYLNYAYSIDDYVSYTDTLEDLNFTRDAELIEDYDYYDDLDCVLDGCFHKVETDIISPIAIKEGKLVFYELGDGPLGIQVPKVHAIDMGKRFINDPEVGNYMRAWGDSLKTDFDINTIVGLGEMAALKGMVNILSTKAPNGYIVDWSWDNDYGPVEMYVKYCNTNSKSIKYIKFYFSVYNDVGDVRGSGSVQGTGPVGHFETASWNFDRTGCWPSGDATKMVITKIGITYMNGTTKTLTGKSIIFD